MFKRFWKAFDAYYEEHRISLVLLIIGSWLLMIRNSIFLGSITITIGIVTPGILKKR